MDESMQSKVETTVGFNPVGENEIAARKAYGDLRYEAVIKMNDDGTKAHTNLVNAKAFFWNSVGVAMVAGTFTGIGWSIWMWAH